MSENQKQRRSYSDGELARLVKRLEAAWPGAAAQPAQPINGFGAGSQPRLSEYGVLVAVAFDDCGYDNAFEMVAVNEKRRRSVRRLTKVDCDTLSDIEGARGC